MYKIIAFFIRLYFRILFPIKIEGIDNLPKDGGFILAGNHISIYDPLLIVGFVPGEQLALAKHTLFKNKIFGGLLKYMGAFPIKRDTTDITAIKKALSHLKKGGSVLLFPQGGRREADDFDDVRDGVAMLAVKSKVPVIPFGISGKYKVFKKLNMRFGKPLHFEEYYGEKLTDNELKPISMTIVNEIKRLLE